MTIRGRATHTRGRFFEESDDVKKPGTRPGF